NNLEGYKVTAESSLKGHARLNIEILKPKSELAKGIRISISCWYCTKLKSPTFSEYALDVENIKSADIHSFFM
ncbi:hypothetical protein B2J68_19995, partial [Vibrio cholerae]|uniref:hypothetical protein n=1 Tax=Vibrio cholerae TaxID=666 RepID=UPI000B6C32ED